MTAQQTVQPGPCGCVSRLCLRRERSLRVPDGRGSSSNSSPLLVLKRGPDSIAWFAFTVASSSALSGTRGNPATNRNRWQATCGSPGASCWASCHLPPSCCAVGLLTKEDWAWGSGLAAAVGSESNRNTAACAALAAGLDMLRHGRSLQARHATTTRPMCPAVHGDASTRQSSNYMTWRLSVHMLRPQRRGCGARTFHANCAPQHWAQWLVHYLPPAAA